MLIKYLIQEQTDDIKLKKDKEKKKKYVCQRP